MPHKDFNRIFPYMCETTVATALKKLKAKGLVMVAHYDEHNSLVNWYVST